ncbi:hypothetical protein B4U79_00459 [Dinothrombium tinctorium]|uniref:Uncharacterized protein n=1 Tax=Dinothrombium tinctorium TaxID=1965070 RepID=A0A443Q828_9ACAR|nr:hypothetical protein B4U79_00459 [Dinothrombium tinctorium]
MFRMQQPMFPRM